MISIDEVHKNNFEIIKKNNFKVGDILRHRSRKLSTITHIHPIYGWVLTDASSCDDNYLKQDWSNIKEFKKEN